MKRVIIFIFVFLFSIDVFAGRKILPESLTVLNSSPSYKRPCVVASERPERETSLSSIFKKMNQDVKDFYCRIGNSPDVRLLLFKPKNFERDSSSSTLTESIQSHITEETEVKIRKERHLIIAGYKVMYPDRCLGRECDIGAYGGCINWCNLARNGRRRLDEDSKPSKCAEVFNRDHSDDRTDGCHDGSWAQDMADGYGWDVVLKANGLWFTFPWVKYIQNDDLNVDKIPLFNPSTWDSEKFVTISKADDGNSPETGQYRAKIVVDDGAAMQFAVAEGAKLSFRYLDIYLNGNARIQFSGKGTVVFTAVRIYGGGDTMIEVSQNSEQQPHFYFSRNRDNEENSYGLELHAMPQLKRFIDLPSGQAQSFFLGLLRDNLRLVIPSEDRQIPAPFYDAEAQNSISCRLAEEWDSQEKGKCLLQSKPFYESADARYYTLQHFGIVSYSANQPGVRKLSYEVFPRIAYQMNNEWNHFPISVKKDDFYFDAKGAAIDVREPRPINCNRENSFTRWYCDAVREVTSTVREVIANGGDNPEASSPPPVELPCPEGTHWDGAFEQCMPDERPHDPDCGEARWDTTLEDCECDSDNKIYDDATKSCRMDDGAGLPDPDDGAEEVDDEDLKDPAGGENNSGGCSLTSANTMNPFPFILFPLLLGLLFFIRQRTRRIL